MSVQLSYPGSIGTENDHTHTAVSLLDGVSTNLITMASLPASVENRSSTARQNQSNKRSH